VSAPADPAFVDMLKALMERNRDADLHDRIWDFREGAISRTDLYRDRTFSAAMQGWYAEELAALAGRGITPDALRAEVEKHRAEQAEQQSEP
jgi:hypothetical protein